MTMALPLKIGTLALGLAALGSPAIAADPPAATEPKMRPLEVVEKVWPEHPEWFAMLVDILEGSQLGPNDGWFRKAKMKTRLDWKATAARYDKDDDGRIARDEFPGSDADFAKLDRDRDKAITSNDFDFSPSALASSPGLIMFYRADSDGDGRLTKAEMDTFFARADAGGLGFVSMDDARAALNPPLQPPPSSSEKPDAGRSGPSRSTLLKGLYRQEIGSLQSGPRVGETAPDFTLKTVDGDQEMTLSRLVGPKPVVLIFGNFTCGPWSSQAGNLEKLYQRYKDRATFVIVYVREAHPTDGWHMDSNERVGVSLRQPQTYDERVGVARSCARKLKFGIPMLVDTIDDAVGARYSGMPSRLYLIDNQGKVAFQNGRGPFGFKPTELEHALVLLLNESAPAAAAEGEEDGSRK
jgi:hypothetical protein